MTIKKRIRAGVASLALVMATTAVAAPVFASGTGNSVNNCFGRWFNTDWDQLCGAGGASVAGNFRSTAACSNQTDIQRTWFRGVGSTTVRDGQDCRFSVAGVVTSYFP